jgi:hypothetical protein
MIIYRFFPEEIAKFYIIVTLVMVFSMINYDKCNPK